MKQDLLKVSMIILFKCLVLGVFVTSIVACTSVEHASELEDHVAKRFQPPVDRAYIYVMRKARFAGFAAVIEVQLNKKNVGHLKNDDYLLIDVAPGQHTIRVLWGGDALEQYNNYASAISINAVNGKMYFLRTSFALHKQLKFKQLPKSVGLKELHKYRRVKQL